MSNCSPPSTKRISNHNSPSSKRRRLSHTDDVVSLLTPSRARQSAVLPKRRPPRPEVTLGNKQQKSSNGPVGKKAKEISTCAASPLPKLVDSPLSSSNIEAALSLIDQNTKKKRESFDKLLQVFHDLYRWSRLPNRDHRNFFRHEFVSELSGISRVMKFLKAHNMGDEFLCQLLQTELPFNE